MLSLAPYTVDVLRAADAAGLLMEALVLRGATIKQAESE
jgi:hypothetical protein